MNSYLDNDRYLLLRKGMKTPQGLITKHNDGSEFKNKICGPHNRTFYSSIKEARKARKRLQDSEYPWQFDVVEVTDIALRIIDSRELCEKEKAKNKENRKELIASHILGDLAESNPNTFSRPSLEPWVPDTKGFKVFSDE